METYVANHFHQRPEKDWQEVPRSVSEQLIRVSARRDGEQDDAQNSDDQGRRIAGRLFQSRDRSCRSILISLPVDDDPWCSLLARSNQSKIEWA